jgi:hypothetical protein
MWHMSGRSGPGTTVRYTNMSRTLLHILGNLNLRPGGSFNPNVNIPSLISVRHVPIDFERGVIDFTVFSFMIAI